MVGIPSSTSVDRTKRRALLFLAFWPVAFVVVVAIVHTRHPADSWFDSAMGTFCIADTEYASGYSEEEFASLRPGTTMEEVERRLGKPLEQNASASGTGWRYSRSPNDRSYRVRVVRFTGDRVQRLIHELYVD